MSAHDPGPQGDDKPGCRDKAVAIAITVFLFALTATLLLGCTCDSSTQPCDTDLSTRNQQQFNPPPEMKWCVQGAALVPCENGD